MSFNFRNLDAETRRFMVAEIEAATRDGNLYSSKRFTPEGGAAWPKLLLEAARSHDESWLAVQIERRGLMKSSESSHTKSGRPIVKSVADNAAETQADGQFNRYYILGLCGRAAATGIPQVIAYRAKHVETPRSTSAALIGSTYDVAVLADQLRPVSSSLRHDLIQPNSGLSVHLP